MFELLEEPKKAPLFAGRTLHKFRDADRLCCEESDYCGHDRDEVSNPAEADVVSSLVKDSDVWHLPVIDLDLPCRLVESGTPGHYHLYIDRQVEWGNYLRLLEALVQAGLVQEGYLGASRERGYTSVRVPWKPKGVAA